ncbi:tRNA guanylyltransferase [Coprinopsis cinerea okayama7|uniref:tRNA(His) guanylyltransferase n=1 Tax=Coprinopsis cinerea (strain Okayama-7 / 130 / ATCC MYA-4618 / FGSC 9003) TaxID=240176 RepID=A8NVB3_COPC7|nr:tRNA guanylyltransferase [Coprinopsis cinerea okayama7\|eukprot:XP_001836645.2 tRNA guanylyltransferase [Coprinopsis cinerea okayama7\
MDRAARELMDLFPDIVLAFGESDEYSFLLKKSTTLFNRRQAKILSTLVSAFTGFYMFYWGEYFGGKSNGGEGKGGEEEGKEEGEEEVKMQYPASFDGRIVVYPSEKEVKDYFRWRQADTHINNLYNTVFWALVKSGKTTTEAHAVLKGTYSKDKHEILFTQFGINYNNIDARFRKGSILVREVVPEEEEIEHNQNDSTPGPSSSTPSHGPDQPSSSQSTDPPPPSQDPSLQPPTSTSTNAPTDATSTSNTPTPASTSTSTSTNTTTSMNTNTPSSTSPSTHPKSKKRPKKPKQPKTRVVLLHCDLIRDEFWDSRPGLLVD